MQFYQEHDIHYMNNIKITYNYRMVTSEGPGSVHPGSSPELDLPSLVPGRSNPSVEPAVSSAWSPLLPGRAWSIVIRGARHGPVEARALGIALLLHRSPWLESLGGALCSGPGRLIAPGRLRPPGPHSPAACRTGHHALLRRSPLPIGPPYSSEAPSFSGPDSETGQRTKPP